MSDYISRKDVLAALSGLLKDMTLSELLKDIKEHPIGNTACAIEAILRIKDLPVEDVKPVVHGTWIIHNRLVKNELLDENEVYVCSACMEQRTKRKYNFCPNCGADMRGVKE